MRQLQAVAIERDAESGAQSVCDIKTTANDAEHIAIWALDVWKRDGERLAAISVELIELGEHGGRTILAKFDIHEVVASSWKSVNLKRNVYRAIINGILGYGV